MDRTSLKIGKLRNASKEGHTNVCLRLLIILACLALSGCAMRGVGWGPPPSAGYEEGAVGHTLICRSGHAWLVRAWPVTYERVRTWLYKADQLAEVPRQKGSLWHAYRREWATERKHLSVTDLAKAGGWSSVVTVQRCYQQADEATMLEVVLGGAKLSERRA